MGAERNRGDGRICLGRGRKIWTLDYYAPGAGKNAGRMVRVRESAGTEDEEVARRRLRLKVEAVRAARRSGGSVELPVTRRVTVGAVLDDYLRDLRLREKKGVRAEDFRLGPESPLREALGHEPAGRLTLGALEAYAERRRTKGSSNATINRDLQGLRSALRRAVRAGQLLRLPPFPEKLKERVRQGFFSSEEVDRLCAKPTPAWLAEMIRFAFVTGWRRGELLALRWEWVDLGEREIRLPDSKNDEGRVVPIAGELRAIMERLTDARRVRRPDGSVAIAETVFHDDGKPITKKRFVKGWNAARKAAKLTDRIFHDFRRSAARRLTNAGVPQQVAMRVTGHKTPSMFRRYSIVEKVDMAQGLEKVASRETRSRKLASIDGRRNGRR
jgi:integrase